MKNPTNPTVPELRPTPPVRMSGWIVFMAVWWVACATAQAATAADYGTDFNSLFPGFVASCARLHDLLVPFSMAMLVLSFGFAFWHGHQNPIHMFQFLIKLFMIVLLITRSYSLINDGQVIIQDFVTNNIPARPENIAQLYKAKLAEAQNAPDLRDKSFTSLLFSSNFFEALVLAALTLISWLAIAVLFFVYIVQKVALLFCWCLSPLLFPLFAIRPLFHLALAHLMRIIGILLWPISIALASTLTEGLLDNQMRAGFLDGVPVAGATGWALQQILGLTVIAIWIIFSSFAGPYFCQRLVSGSAGAAGLLSQGGGMLANLALPGGINAILSASGALARAYSSRGAAAAGSPQPVPAMPSDTPEPPPTNLAQEFAPQNDPNDPTAQQQVDEAIASTNRPNPDL